MLPTLEVSGLRRKGCGLSQTAGVAGAGLAEGERRVGDGGLKEFARRLGEAARKNCTN
jgi:hypothetical protein